jgi:hypothetical protein
MDTRSWHVRMFRYRQTKHSMRSASHLHLGTVCSSFWHYAFFRNFPCLFAYWASLCRGLTSRRFQRFMIFSYNARSFCLKAPEYSRRVSLFKRALPTPELPPSLSLSPSSHLLCVCDTRSRHVILFFQTGNVS